MGRHSGSPARPGGRPASETAVGRGGRKRWRVSGKRVSEEGRWSLSRVIGEGTLGTARPSRESHKRWCPSAPTPPTKLISPLGRSPGTQIVHSRMRNESQLLSVGKVLGEHPAQLLSKDGENGARRNGKTSPKPHGAATMEIPYS